MNNYSQIGNFEAGVPQTFSQIFEARLQKGEFHINQLFPVITFYGNSSYVLRASDYPDEADINEQSGVGMETQPKTVNFFRRVIFTKKMTYSVRFAAEDLSVSGFVPSEAAVKSAEGCQRALDRICIEAFTADVPTENSDPIKFDKRMIIPYDYGAEHYSDNLDAEGKKAAHKLTAAKLNKAMAMMNANNIHGNVVCLLSPAQRLGFRMDKFVRNTDYNLQPAMATGATGPYAGMDMFIDSTLLPRNVKSVKDGTKVDYAYIICTDYMRVGTNMPWQFDEFKAPQLGCDYGIITRGMYGAIRTEEAAVAVIETEHEDALSIL